MAALLIRRISLIALLALGAPFRAGAAEAPADAPPPAITHTTAGQKITRDVNDCLTCHAAPANEKAGARAVTDAHYVHRNGERLDKILPARAFCLQCHTPGPDAKPLPIVGGRP